MQSKPEKSPIDPDDDLDIPELTQAFFERAERGKYARPERQGYYRLSPDVAKAFPDEASVEDALRMLKETAERAAGSGAATVGESRADAVEEVGTENAGTETADTEDDRRKAS